MRLLRHAGPVLALLGSIVVLLLASGACTTGGTDDDSSPSISLPTTPVASTTPTTTTAADDARDDAPSPSTDTGSPAGPADDRELRWTVVAVEFDDVLNVRSAPDPAADIVGTLAPWSTDLDVTGEVAGDETAGIWRQVRLRDGSVGWANARFLVAQPVDFDVAADGPAMVEATSDLIAHALGDDARPADAWLSDRSLWLGGTGIYGDGHNGWEWVDGSTLHTRSAWEIPREFGPPFGATTCGSDCVLSVTDYLKVERLGDRHQILVDDRADPSNGGFIDGQMFLAPDDLHRTVIDAPATTFVAEDGSVQPNLDWQRIHAVFDWSGGTPAIALVHTWGWTP